MLLRESRRLLAAQRLARRERRCDDHRAGAEDGAAHPAHARATSRPISASGATPSTSRRRPPSGWARSGRGEGIAAEAVALISKPRAGRATIERAAAQGRLARGSSSRCGPTPACATRLPQLARERAGASAAGARSRADKIHLTLFFVGRFERARMPALEAIGGVAARERLRARARSRSATGATTASSGRGDARVRRRLLRSPRICARRSRAKACAPTSGLRAARHARARCAARAARDVRFAPCAWRVRDFVLVESEPSRRMRYACARAGRYNAVMRADYVDAVRDALRRAGQLCSDWTRRLAKLREHDVSRSTSEVVIQRGARPRALLVAEGARSRRHHVRRRQRSSLRASGRQRHRRAIVLRRRAALANVWAVTDGALLRWEFEQYRASARSRARARFRFASRACSRPAAPDDDSRPPLASTRARRPPPSRAAAHLAAVHRAIARRSRASPCRCRCARYRGA